MYEMGARFYDPSLKRWLSPDTIVRDAGNPEALNRYGYSYNNPINYTDPSGHCPPRDDECWELQQETESKYGVIMNGDWSKSDISALQDALDRMSLGVEDRRVLSAILWNTRALTRVRLEGPGVLAAFSDPLTGNIMFWNGTFSFGYQNALWTIVHEFGHAIDAWNGFPGHAQGINTAMTFIFQSNPLLCALNGDCASSAFPVNAAEDWASSYAAYILPNNERTTQIYTAEQIRDRQAFVALQLNLMMDTLIHIAPQIFPHDLILPRRDSPG